MLYSEHCPLALFIYLLFVSSQIFIYIHIQHVTYTGLDLAFFPANRSWGFFLYQYTVSSFVIEDHEI